MGVGAVRSLRGDPGGYAQLLGGAASMILGDGPGPSRMLLVSVLTELDPTSNIS